MAWARGEFRWHPEVWLVWARPEITHLWYIRGLLEKGLVHRVLGRPPLPGEADHLPTTHPESYNLRLGLAALAAEYGANDLDEPEPYVLCQAADVLPNEGTYRFVDDKLHDGFRAVVFNWSGSGAEAWHTNFFAVPLEEHYWPPLSTAVCQDTLERQWGIRLAALRPPDIFKTGNHNDKRFKHWHRSEQLPAWPRRPEQGSEFTSLTLRGYKPWWQQLAGVCAWCINFIFRRG